MKHASFKTVLGAAALGIATVLAVATGCARDSEAAPAPKDTPVSKIAASSHVEGKNFKLDAALEGTCTVGATCVVVLRLETAGAFHINKEYPYKMKAEGSGIEFQGTDSAGKNVFSKAAGDFKAEGEKLATLRVKFKPTAKGNVTISGKYKMSVCSDKECQIESPDIEASVAVK